MLELKVKDVRETLEETLGKFYAFPDFSVGSTKVMDKDKEFRIEFRIYDNEFWMDIDPSIDNIHICSHSFGEPNHLDSLHMWLSKPFKYDKSKFEFGWRTDLEVFFDAFNAALLEKVQKMQKTDAASVYGSSTKTGETKSVMAQCIDAIYDKPSEAKTTETKASIFNSLKKDDEDEYI